MSKKDIFALEALIIEDITVGYIFILKTHDKERKHNSMLSYSDFFVVSKFDIKVQIELFILLCIAILPLNKKSVIALLLFEHLKK